MSVEKYTPKEDAMLSMIERVAANPDADIAKMERLMEMRNQELARVARQAFAADFALMAPELPLVAKTKNNAQTKSKYAALEDINQQVNPILSKHGFATSTKITEQTIDSVTVEAILWHKEGHTESTKVTFPLDNKGMQGTVNKTTVHATASSITYAKRVALCALLNISTGDDVDGNKEDNDLATDSQRTAIATVYNKLSPEQKDEFNKSYGGIAEIKKVDVNLVIVLINKKLKAPK